MRARLSLLCLLGGACGTRATAPLGLRDTDCNVRYVIVHGDSTFVITVWSPDTSTVCRAVGAPSG